LCKRVFEPRCGKVIDLDLSPGGDRLLVGTEHGNVLVYDLATGALLKDLFVDTDPITDVEFDPTGTRLLAVTLDCTRIWNAKSLELEHTLREQRLSMLHAAFSADGQWVATGSSGDAADPTRATDARVWESSTGHYVAIVPDLAFCVRPIFSPQEAMLLASSQGAAELFTLEVGGKNKVKELKAHSTGITYAAWSPDGKLVLSVSSDLTGRVWNPETGNVLHVLKGHTGAPVSCEFSPDGKDVSTTSTDDRTTRVWSLKSGQERLVLAGHTEGPTAVRFSPDGRTIASFDAGGHGNLFELERGSAALKFEGHRGLVSKIAFTSDSKRIVSGSHDGTVRVWVNPRAKP
jgi:WD40 repeat protein